MLLKDILKKREESSVKTGTDLNSFELVISEDDEDYIRLMDDINTIENDIKSRMERKNISNCYNYLLFTENQESLRKVKPYFVRNDLLNHDVVTWEDVPRLVKEYKDGKNRKKVRKDVSEPEAEKTASFSVDSLRLLGEPKGAVSTLSRVTGFYIDLM